MQTLFECTVRYDKPVEGTDKQKKVNEVYLFDALTYTEAEKRAYEQLPEVIKGEFLVVGIRKARYAEIIPSEVGGYWYKVRISFVYVDENSGKEKNVTQTVLTMAEDIKSAVDATAEAMGDNSDFRVKAVNESNILDFFPYMEKKEEPLPGDVELSRMSAEEYAAQQAAREDMIASGVKPRI